MLKLVLFLVLLICCWPLAMVALVLYPLVWLVLLPLRIVGFALTGVVELLGALFMLPSRVVRAL
jgi:hypothetical protein